VECYTLPPLLLYNGTVRTMDPARPGAEAVLVQHGRISAVGGNADLGALAPGAVAIDLGGRTVLPGLEDAHLHLCEYGLTLTGLRLHECTSLEQVLEKVQVAAQAPGSGWIRGYGWSQSAWPGAANPTRFDLDRVAPGRPVAIHSRDMHSLWVNTRALTLAGVDANTQDVAGGEILRDRAGAPVGIFSENARELIERRISAPSARELQQAARLAIAEANRLGLTAVHSCEAPESFAALAELERSGELPIRIWHMLPVRLLDEALALRLTTGFGSERLRIGHVKLFADGALGSGTAEMLEPYEDAPESLGVAATGTEDLYDAILRAANGRLASAVHAIGDAANHRVLDVFERVAHAAGSMRLRQRIEHVQLITPEDQARLAGLGLVASMQPIHCTQDRPLAERRWGARCSYAYPWRSLAELGVPLAFGSDAPVEDINPLVGLHAAVTRRRAGQDLSEAWHPEQALSLNQALAAYTMGSAYAACAERERGSLTPGKRGDIIVLSGTLDNRDPDALLDLQVDYTIVGGQIVFAR